jgi:hypothetical protein
VKGNNIALGFATASTQEGNSAYFDTSTVLQCLRFAPILRSMDLAKAIWTDVPDSGGDFFLFYSSFSVA